MNAFPPHDSLDCTPPGSPWNIFVYWQSSEMYETAESTKLCYLLGKPPNLLVPINIVKNLGFLYNYWKKEMVHWEFSVLLKPVDINESQISFSGAFTPKRHQYRFLWKTDNAALWGLLLWEVHLMVDNTLEYILLIIHPFGWPLLSLLSLSAQLPIPLSASIVACPGHRFCPFK